MPIHFYHKPETSKAAANSISVQKKGQNAPSSFSDKRPERAQQELIQQMADRSNPSATGQVIQRLPEETIKALTPSTFPFDSRTKFSKKHLVDPVDDANARNKLVSLNDEGIKREKNTVIELDNETGIEVIKEYLGGLKEVKDIGKSNYTTNNDYPAAYAEIPEDYVPHLPLIRDKIKVRSGNSKLVLGFDNKFGLRISHFHGTKNPSLSIEPYSEPEILELDAIIQADKEAKQEEKRKKKQAKKAKKPKEVDRFETAAQEANGHANATEKARSSATSAKQRAKSALKKINELDVANALESANAAKTKAENAFKNAGLAAEKAVAETEQKLAKEEVLRAQTATEAITEIVAEIEELLETVKKKAEEETVEEKTPGPEKKTPSPNSKSKTPKKGNRSTSPPSQSGNGKKKKKKGKQKEKESKDKEGSYLWKIPGLIYDMLPSWDSLFSKKGQPK